MKSQLRIATIVILSNAAGCNYTQGDCYPVGQSGDPGGPVIVSTGTGVPSGDAPLGQAQDALSGSACNAPDDSTEMGTYIRCRGLDWITCEALCLDIGAQCSALALNPDRPELGTGKLKQCQQSAPGTTCTYCFLGGSISCSQVKAFGRPILWLCNLPGGKGCE
jgi:hypothetical protein